MHVVVRGQLLGVSSLPQHGSGDQVQVARLSRKFLSRLSGPETTDFFFFIAVVVNVSKSGLHPSELQNYDRC